MNIFNLIDEDITLVLDNLPVGIIRINSNGKCVYSNKYISDILNVYNADDIYDKYISCLHDDDRSTELEACKNFLHNHIETNTLVRIFNKTSNEYRWYSNQRTVIRSRDDLSFMNTLLDIHENKQMELQLRKETLKAEQANNHKSAFLANMSHEIRTPLNGIIGMLTLLEDTVLNADQQDYILMVKECSFNLMTIINDILDFSKLEIGKIQLDIQPMNLQYCIESTNDIIMSKVYEKSLEYVTNISSNIPKYIKSDSNRIKQILLNLLSNSIKFTDKGSIILNINTISYEEYNMYKKIATKKNKIYDEKKTNDKSKGKEVLKFSKENLNKIYLKFDIIDSGCGIHQDDINKLFKSFSQVDNRVTSKIYQGTGLGLVISKELVDLMNGYIWLNDSTVGKGSTFSFIIESEIANEVIDPEDESINDKILKDKSVLIVDDNFHNRISLSAIVTKWGMRPHTFSNGEEALHFTKLTNFDIGLIDICMPKMDGHAFASKLKEQIEFNNKTIPLIALSSLGDKVSTLSKHFKSHLIKPIKEYKLKQLCIDSLTVHSKKLNENIIENNTLIDNCNYNHQSLENYIHDNNLSELKNNVRILIAEDVYINQRVVVSFLNKMGFDNIKLVENGQMCIDEIFNNNYDIVLLDIRMPIKSGESVLIELNQYFDNNKNKRKPYVVAVTAYSMKEDKEKYLNMGFDDYISKPISNKLLEKCMNKFIEKLLKE